MKLTDRIWNKAILKYKHVQIGKHCDIRGKLFVHGGGTLIIGNSCSIYSDELVNPTSGFNHCHFVVYPDAKIVIGNGVGMSHVNVTAMDSIVIEDSVLLGSGVKIWDTDFHALKREDRGSNKEKVSTAPVVIHEGAFVGACSIILKGVSIGKNAVIGAGSIVTKSVPDNEIWAGNPARYIKELQDHTEIANTQL